MHVFQFDKESLRERGEHAFAELRTARFQEADAAGIVFFARFFEYFHDVYVNFLEHAGAPLAATLSDNAWLAPIRHAEADYLKPLRFGEPIEVALVRAHVAATEITFGFRVAAADGRRVFAVGQIVHTFVDPRTFQRRPVPDALVQACAQLLS